MSAKKDIGRLLRLIRRQGCGVKVAGNGHWVITLPNNGGKLHCASSPRCPHAAKNLASDLRKRGIEVRP